MGFNNSKCCWSSFISYKGWIMSELKRKDLFPWSINTKKMKIVNNTKWCDTCQRQLELDKFDKNETKYLGYVYWCRECFIKYG